MLEIKRVFEVGFSAGTFATTIAFPNFFDNTTSYFFALLSPIVIRGLAVGSIDSSNQRRFLKREFTMGLALSIVLGVAGCIRAAVFMTPWLETLAITTSLFMIVIISIVLGALLPLGMKKVGIDPAHSSTTIQVVMDILGVTITVWMSSLVLDSNFKDWLSSSFLDA